MALPSTSASVFSESSLMWRAPSTANGDAADCYFVTIELQFSSSSAVSNAGVWVIDDVQLWSQAFTGLAPRIDAYDAVRARALLFGNPSGADEIQFQSSGTGLLVRSRLQTADRMVTFGEASSNKRIDVTINGTVVVEETVSAAGVSAATAIATTGQIGNLKLQQDSHLVGLGSCVQLVDNTASATPAADYVTWYRTMSGWAMPLACWSGAITMIGNPSTHSGPYTNTSGTFGYFVVDLTALLDSACAVDSPYTTLTGVGLLLVPMETTYVGATTYASIDVYRETYLLSTPAAANPASTGATATINGTALNAAALAPVRIDFTPTVAEELTGALAAGKKLFAVIGLQTTAAKSSPQLVAIELSGKTYRIAPN
jgi:hypothetical protein